MTRARSCWSFRSRRRFSTPRIVPSRSTDGATLHQPPASVPPRKTFSASASVEQKSGTDVRRAACAGSRLPAQGDKASARGKRHDELFFGTAKLFADRSFL